MVCFIQNKTKFFSEKESEKMWTKMLILGTSELWNKGWFFKNVDFPGGTVAKNPHAHSGYSGSLGRESSTCRGATGSVGHSCHARVPQLLKPAHLEPVLRNGTGHHSERPARCERVALAHCSWRKPAQGNKDPVQPKLNKIIKTSCCLHFLLFYSVRALIM